MVDLNSAYCKNPQPFLGDLILNKKLDTVVWANGRTARCLTFKCQDVYGKSLSQCTLYDLARIPKETLRSTNGMGDTTFSGIECKLKEFGLHVGMTETEIELYRITYGTADLLRMQLGTGDTRKIDERPLAEILELTVSEVDWGSARARNCMNALCKSYFDKSDTNCTLRELVSIDDESLIRTRNMGRHTLPQIREVLKRLGLHMGMTPEELDALCQYEQKKFADNKEEGPEENNGVPVEINCHGGPLPDNQGGKGDWYDLFVDEDVDMKAGEFRLISMGVSIKVPKGYTAYMLPRSSTFKKFGLLQTNSMGVIDSSYCGDNDIIRFPALATRDVHISKGDRIAQLTIMPTVFINWNPVDKLDDPDRGGFGTTGL